MKIEIIQGATHTLTGREKPCAECEEDRNNPNGDPGRVQDRVSLSQKGSALAGENGETASADRPAEAASSEKAANRARPRTETELTPEEKQLLDQLRSRDREVRSHEQAHKAAAGPYAKGPPTYEYQTGPDGRRYAIGGEVQIDTSKVPGNPRATLVKAQTIKRAANAPKNPSAQDRQIAAQAAQMEAEARRELQAQKREETQAAGGFGNAANGVAAVGRQTPPADASSSASAGDADNPQETNASQPTGAGENRRALQLIANFQSEPPPRRGALLNIVS